MVNCIFTVVSFLRLSPESNNEVVLEVIDALRHRDFESPLEGYAHLYEEDRSSTRPQDLVIRSDSSSSYIISGPSVFTTFHESRYRTCCTRDSETKSEVSDCRSCLL